MKFLVYADDSLVGWADDPLLALSLMSVYLHDGRTCHLDYGEIPQT